MDFPNRELSVLPALGSEAYEHRPPVWLVQTVRGLLALGGLVLLWQMVGDDAPLLLRVFLGGLAAAFWFFVFTRQIWGKVVRFVADRQGIYFPSNDLYAGVVGRRVQVHHWLFVPWCNISNLRLDQVRDSDGQPRPCVAFEVQLAGSQEANFFYYVAEPDGQRYDIHGARSLAYGDNPPAPKDTLIRLQRLSGRGDAVSPG